MVFHYVTYTAKLLIYKFLKLVAAENPALARNSKPQKIPR